MQVDHLYLPLLQLREVSEWETGQNPGRGGEGCKVHGGEEGNRM